MDGGTCLAVCSVKIFVGNSARHSRSGRHVQQCVKFLGFLFATSDMHLPCHGGCEARLEKSEMVPKRGKPSKCSHNCWVIKNTSNSRSRNQKITRNKAHADKTIQKSSACSIVVYGCSQSLRITRMVHIRHDACWSVGPLTPPLGNKMCNSASGVCGTSFVNTSVTEPQKGCVF